MKDTMPEPRTVTVPPRVWTTVLDDVVNDRTIDIWHDNTDDITFVVDDEAGTVEHDTDHEPYPADGWRTRAVPNEIRAMATLSVTGPAAGAALDAAAEQARADALLDNHPAVTERQAAQDRIDIAIQTALGEGWMVEVAELTDTGVRFELTDDGRRHTEKQLGLPDGALG